MDQVWAEFKKNGTGKGEIGNPGTKKPENRENGNRPQAWDGLLNCVLSISTVGRTICVADNAGN